MAGSQTVKFRPSRTVLSGAAAYLPQANGLLARTAPVLVPSLVRIMFCTGHGADPMDPLIPVLLVTMVFVKPARRWLPFTMFGGLLLQEWPRTRSRSAPG